MNKTLGRGNFLCFVSFYRWPRHARDLLHRSFRPGG